MPIYVFYLWFNLSNALYIYIHIDTLPTTATPTVYYNQHIYPHCLAPASLAFSVKRLSVRAIYIYIYSEPLFEVEWRGDSTSSHCGATTTATPLSFQLSITKDLHIICESRSTISVMIWPTFTKPCEQRMFSITITDKWFSFDEVILKYIVAEFLHWKF